MYHAKRIGGDRIDVFKPAMRARKIDRLSLESDLRRAIEREEITILYQPIVRLDDRVVAGFEALARWNHPRLGRMSPAEFITIAEEIGLIVELGLFVLERTARQLSIWQRALRQRDPVFASVNVSSRQLLRHDLIQDLRTVLARAPLARGTLKLELTESVVMENPEHAAQMLHRIRELGAGLALDDFGTGHSSLAYLQRFPFDTIKIDQSFVRTTAKGTRPVILRSIIALAHDLGMDVVAEGRGNRFRRGRALSARLRIRAGLRIRRADDRRARARRCCSRGAAWSWRAELRRGIRSQQIGDRKQRAHACPASLDSMPRSMPIFFNAFSYLPPISVPKMSSGSAAQCSQPFPWISFSSWPGRPAGVAERQDRARRPVAARDRLEDVERRGEADAVVDRQRRILDEEIGAVQHEAALGLDRPAAHDLHDAGAGRQSDDIGCRNHVELHQQIGKVDVGRRMVDDNTHRALGGMGADVDERAGETFVHHRRHGDQHLAVEITPAPTSILSRCAARQFHSRKVADRSAFANEWQRQKFTPIP